MIKFNNHFESPVKPDQVKYDKIDTVERSGVIPLRNQIQSFKEAGVLLRATRALQYDFDQDIPDIEKVETIFHSAGVDYSDMSELTKRSLALKKVNNNLQSKVETPLEKVSTPEKMES